ncbi:MAG TPA: hypothetical protein GX528_09430 [Firmicutes bacterium]|nr:hypothetical protein [Bacillota bacterium]
MRKLSALIVILCFTLTAGAHASAWDLWAPTAPIVSDSFWGVPFWPDWNFNPTPAPNPKPNPSRPINPGTPIVPVQPGPPKDEVPLPGASLSADEQSLFNKVNQERLKMGVKALKHDPGLTALAKEKSYDMAVHRYFSHVSPNFGTVYNMLTEAGIAYLRAGENIAKTGSLARIHPLFMGSADHRVNILHSGYTHMGIGIVKYGTSYYATQIFIKK